MALKRTARDAFEKPNGGPLSAFAAAKLARQAQDVPTIEQDVPDQEVADSVAATLGAEPYDGLRDEVDPTSIVAELGRPSRTPPKATQSTQLSSFRRTSKTVLQDDETRMRVVLKANQSFTVVGEYDLTVEKGAVSVYGATLTPLAGTLRVFAPSIQALPQVIARKDDTLIAISSAKSTLRKLEKLAPTFRNIWAADSHGRSFAYLETSDDDPLQRSLYTIESSSQRLFMQLASKVESKSGRVKVMAVGPKSSGKSTFNRQLCNTLLTHTPIKRVVYLDIDPGQPEFSPPGQISLVEVLSPILGPPFTHPATAKSPAYRLIAAHTLAASSFKDDPEYYLACVRELISNHYLPLCSEGKSIPLIINSCGWVTGVGANVLSSLFGIVSITDTAIIDTVDSSIIQTAQSKSENCYNIPRSPGRPSARTPAELRSMQTMAYFHHTESESVVPKWTGKSINQVRPWIGKYFVDPDDDDKHGPGIKAIMSYGQPVQPAFLAEVLDGSLVALITAKPKDEIAQATPSSSSGRNYDPTEEELELEEDLEADTLIRHTPGQESLPYIHNGGTFLRPFSPFATRYEGLALVSAIDVERREIHLITPLPESQMAELLHRQVMLVRGNFDAPEWAYLEEVFRDGISAKSDTVKMRPWVTSREVGGIEGAVWRLRHPPTASQVAGGR